MRPTILTCCLCLLLAPAVHADIYQCPDTTGRLRYQDVPCAGAVPPLLESLPAVPTAPLAPPPPALQHMQRGLECTNIGQIAANIAHGRDNGTVRLSMRNAVQNATADATIKAMLGTLVDTIYTSRLSPQQARQMGYESCMASLR